MTSQTNFSVGSLFAGVGGICLGFKNAKYKNLGYQLTFANEIDEFAARTYSSNFDHNLIVGDIEKIINPDLAETEEEKEQYRIKQNEILENRIDVLNGGFPCQAFSIAGEQKGFKDHRGNLFMSIINLIKLLDQHHGKPRILLLENVKNLKSHDKGNTYNVIKGELEKVGYIIKEAVLNTMYFSDLPQNRERIYIVGFLNKEDADKFTMFDRLNDYYKVKSPNERIETIREILDLDLNFNNGFKYYYTREKYPNYFLTEEEYLNLPSDKRKKERINLDEQITEECQFYQVRRGMYVRKNQSDVCPTLTANMGTGGHNVPLIKVADGIRKLTPNETFKLQGFPINNGYTLPKTYGTKNYPESQLYKQAGNAVSVPVVKLLAEEILKVLYK